MTPIARLALVATIFFGMLVTTPATAAPREAQERFEEGRALVKAGNPAEAIPKFLASIAADPTTAAVLNLADCYEKVGKLASAHARFRQAQELSREKDPPRSDEARKRAELLEPRVSTITFLPPAHPEEARVWIDGVEVPSSEWGKPRPYDAGHHEVVMQDKTGKRRIVPVDVRPNAARMTLPIEGVEAPAAPVRAPDPSVSPPPAPAPAADTDRSTTRTLGIVLGAGGVVAIGVGAVTGLVALGAGSDLKDACPAYPQCPADRRGELVDLDDRARSFGTISTITFIAGAILLTTGVVMMVAGSSSRQGQLRPPATVGIAW
jgi:hypothetical protein